MTHVFSFDQVMVARGGRICLRDCSAQFDQGQCWQLTGKNGSGKSTLLAAMASLLPIVSGQIKWIAPFSKADVAFMGHRLGLNPRLSTLQALRASLGIVNLNPKDWQQALQDLNLWHLRAMPVQRLSQGQKQALAWARLLLMDKKVWLLDEAFSSLDVDRSAWLQQQCLDHMAGGGLVLYVAHQPLDVLDALSRRLSCDDLMAQNIRGEWQ